MPSREPIQPDRTDGGENVALHAPSVLAHGARGTGGLDIGEPPRAQIAYAATMVGSGLSPFDVGNQLAQRALGLASGAAEVTRQVRRAIASIPTYVDGHLPLAAAGSTSFAEPASHIL